jgi:two-component system OmpR family response regulator
MNILVIESMPLYVDFLSQTLSAPQYLLNIETDGERGLAIALHNRFDLILIDGQLQFMNGLDLVRRLRHENDSTPILVFSDTTNPVDKATALYAGADDFIEKPCDPGELKARIFALYRRRTGGFCAPTILRVGDLELNVAEKAAYRGNHRIILTAQEFRLLEFLILNTGRVVTKTQILEKVWESTTPSKPESVIVYINFLRNKIDRDFDLKLIHTVLGLGYLIRT